MFTHTCVVVRGQTEGIVFIILWRFWWSNSGHRFNAFIFWSTLQALCLYVTPTMLCSSPRWALLAGITLKWSLVYHSLSIPDQPVMTQGSPGHLFSAFPQLHLSVLPQQALGAVWDSSEIWRWGAKDRKEEEGMERPGQARASSDLGGPRDRRKAV